MPTILDGTRLFARLHSLDFECPKCGRIVMIRPRVRTTGWNPRSGLYHCPECQASIMFGVLMYPVAGGRRATVREIPDDWIPTPRQGAALRQLQTGIYLAPRHRRTTNPTIPRNARGPACRCVVEPPGPGTPAAGQVVHPACPVHRGAPAPDPRPPAPARPDGATTNTPRELEPSDQPFAPTDPGGIDFFGLPDEDSD